MRLMDVNAQARALRARAEARYGPAEGLFDRMQAPTAAACRRGCGASGLKTCRPARSGTGPPPSCSERRGPSNFPRITGITGTVQVRAGLLGQSPTARR